jgi:glycosyltransferase involved in cell wall biosynthesis
MRLILNLSNNLSGGGLQVALSVMEECKKITAHFYHVFLGKTAGDQVDTTSFPNNFTFYNIPQVQYWRLYSYLKPLERQIQPDCVFTVFGPSYWKPNSPHVMGFGRGFFLYRDYDFIKHQLFKNRVITYLRSVMGLFLFKKDADHFIIETEDAKSRLIKKLHTNEVSVVSNTCSSYYFQYKTYPNKLPARKGNEIRLITITSYYPHKNLESIPAVLSELKEKNINNINFVLTLKNDDYNKIIPEEWRHRVYNIGPIRVMECPSLYNECDILYLPTLLEMFTASYPEAMVMGKPILTSDLSFAKSICGDAALYFNPYNINDITNCIERIISDKSLYQECIERGKERFKDFPNAAERTIEYLNICEKIIKCDKAYKQERCLF